MKKRIRFLVLAALIAVVCPLLLVSCDAPPEPTHEKDISAEFSSIVILSEDCDVRILPATDGKTHLTGALRHGRTLSAEVTDGTLTVKVEDTRSWWQKLFSRSSLLTVTLGGSEYGDLTIEGETGNVEVGDGFSFKNVQISLSTGNVALTSVTADALTFTGSTGDLALSDVTVAGDISIEQSTGNCVLTSVLASAVTLGGSTGDTYLTDLTVMGAIDTQRSTGKTVATRVAAASISAVADTGRMEFTDVTTVGALSVTTTTGKSTHTNIKAGSVRIEADTGNVSLSAVTSAGALAVETTTGDIRLTDVLVGSIRLLADTGNVDLARVDAADIDIETDTGHVKGTLLTEKVFIARSDTGRIDVPETLTGGRCKVVTDTGRIELRLAD